jgi:diaminopimelate decarboxylase
MSSKPYEPPEVTPIKLAKAALQPTLRIRGRDRETIDGHSIRDLVARFGCPLYVLSEQTLRDTARRFLQAFREHYPDTHLAYSYKTNYLSAVCAIMHEEGALAEVVSGFEYEIARDLGVPGERIVFNGPVKSDAELTRAVEDGARVNIDSFSELDRLARLAASWQRPVDVGIRVNMKLNYPPWDKFGFNLESGQAYEAARRIANDPWLELRGLHMHAGTFITDTSLYERVIEALIELGLRVEAELGARIESLDTGGGYASVNTLHTQLMRGEATSPTFAQYAAAIAGPLSRRVSQFKSPPRLLLEPGRAVVEPCMSLVASVAGVKTFAAGGRGVILDVGVNVLPTAYWYQHDMEVISDEARPMEVYNVLGGLCMNIDVLRMNARLPAMRVGDLVLIRNVGAYNISQSMQFIFPRPPVVLLRDGEAAVVRRRETGADIRRLEQIPEHLRTESMAGSILLRGDAAAEEREET